MWKSKRKAQEYYRNNSSIRITKKTHRFLTKIANKKGIREVRRIPLSEIMEQLAEKEWKRIK